MPHPAPRQVWNCGRGRSVTAPDKEPPGPSPTSEASPGRTALFDDDGLQRVAERGGLVGGYLHHQSATALQRNTHDDPAALLGHFERTIPGTGLHGRHVRLPPELT